jgi:hypothetical protein
VGQVDVPHASAAYLASELVSLVNECLPHNANHTPWGSTPHVGCEVPKIFSTSFAH